MSGFRTTPGGRQFAVPDGTYLLSHSVGCLPLAASQALASAFLGPWAERGGDAWPAWLSAAARFRQQLAALLGGQADEWCPQAGVTAGVFRLLSALPSGRRDQVLLSEHAFPSIAYALGGLEKLGYRLRLVHGDPVDPGAWRRAMGAEVAAAVFMHVHSNSGLLSPIAELASLARSRDIFTIADVCQSAGIVPLDVRALGTDAVVGSCIKWLCGGPGAGFLWVRGEAIERLRPPDRGWFSHAEPFDFAIGEFRYADDARRFWGGTPSIAPLVVANCGLEAIAAEGVPAIHAHNRVLLGALAAGLPVALGAAFEPERIGGTLCLNFGAQALSVEERLRTAGVSIDRRGPVLRLSFHCYNTIADVATVTGALPA